MSEQTANGARAESEAAGWFTRLGETPIATQTWQDFNRWRQTAANAAAYDAVEARWQAAGKTIQTSKRRLPRRSAGGPLVAALKSPEAARCCWAPACWPAAPWRAG